MNAAYSGSIINGSILFYTLPISYFISITLSLSKLSSEYETIVITSFGLNPLKIIKLFLPTTIILSLLLLLISLGLIPKAKYLKESFIVLKKQEAKFNIKTSEYGQQIGSWLIYVDSEQKQEFKNIILLKLEDNKDTFISANSATIETLPDSVNIHLKYGKNFIISDTVKQVDFKEMSLSHTTATRNNIKSLNDIGLYWSDIDTNPPKMKDIIFSVLMSLFPTISIFFIIAVGYFNPRYNSNTATFISVSISIVYIVLISKLATQFALYSPYFGPTILIGLWFILGYIYYALTTKKLY